MAPATAAEKATGSISVYGPARTTVTRAPLSAEDLSKTHAYWRACNYLKPALEKTPIADPAHWQC
jgi:xylulose-5-phosphate/fructose-6-phosphate phosphoketolase